MNLWKYRKGEREQKNRNKEVRNSRKKINIEMESETLKSLGRKIKSQKAKMVERQKDEKRERTKVRKFYGKIGILRDGMIEIGKDRTK